MTESKAAMSFLVEISAVPPTSSDHAHGYLPDGQPPQGAAEQQWASTHNPCNTSSMLHVHVNGLPAGQTSRG